MAPNLARETGPKAPDVGARVDSVGALCDGRYGFDERQRYEKPHAQRNGSIEQFAEREGAQWPARRVRFHAVGASRGAPGSHYARIDRHVFEAERIERDRSATTFVMSPPGS